MARSRGISVLEIIIIITIVAVILGIVMPLGVNERIPAKRTTCLSNVKQIALGLSMYSDEYDDYLPPAAVWANACLPELKNVDVMRCPGLASNPGDDVYGHAFRS